MSNQTISTSMTMEECISLGLLSGENITINGGAVLTCTETPSVLIGSVTINYGELHIDGQNITNGNVVNFVGEGGLINGSNDQTIIVNGQGKLNITGAWFDIGITDGTDNQVIDLSTATGVGYWNKDGVDFCVDVIPMIQIETGRRIDFDNYTGTIPSVGDWIYKTSDKGVMGKIKEVGTDYLIVWSLTGTLLDNDPIHCQKVVDNFGPDMQISWTALVNNVNGDIKADGVYMEFGNARSNGNNYISDFGNGLGGLVFHHAFKSTDLTLGSNTGSGFGGFKPPSGCKIRVPNVIINTSSLVGEGGSGTPYADGDAFGCGTNDNETELFAIECSAGGDIFMSTCNWGNAYSADSGASKYEVEYVGFTVGFGVSVCGSKSLIRHAVVCQAPEVNAAGVNIFGNVLDTVNGADVSFSMTINARLSVSGVFGASTSFNVSISNCIYSMAGAGTTQKVGGKGYSFITVTNGNVDNCLYFGAEPDSVMGNAVSIATSKDISISNMKLSATQNYISQTRDLDLFRLNNSNNIKIVGIDQIGGGSPGGNFIAMTDAADIKIRAIGMIDDRIDLGSHGKAGVEVSGLGSNTDIARCWFDKSTTVVEEFITVIVTAKNTMVQNCASKYLAEVQISGTDTKFKGISGGGGAVSSATGWEDALVGSYGRSIHDAFESDTAGALACVMITPSTDINDTNIIAGNPLFYKDGDLDMVSGDIIEFEQGYFMKGHTGFTGGYTAATGSASRGANEWSKVILEFQYMFKGGSWNGSWLDVRTPSNLTGISGDIAGGIKFKFRFTATGTQNSMSMLLIDTTTSLTAQRENFYPIDQVESHLTITGLKEGTEVRVYRASDGVEIMGVENSGTTFTGTYSYIEDFNVTIRIASLEYVMISMNEITLTANDITIPVQQQKDRWYLNN